MADTSRERTERDRRGGVPRDSRRVGSRARRPISARGARDEARSSLRRFRQGSKLAIGATALLILLVGGSASEAGGFADGTLPGEAAAGNAAASTGPEATAPPVQDAPSTDTAVAQDPAESARRATGTLRDLGRRAYNALPAIGIALAILLIAAVVARLVRAGLRAAFSNWVRAEAVAALSAIFIWLLALGAALSVMAGDARALVGSIGLFGLALSWALQTPIESFTGWLLNSFRSYYRVGDRIAVGEVFGDVAGIDFLTTTVF
ncbi:MAG: mechanosensitive ion channel, partial [Gemmatimonadota bacterium]